MNRMAIYLLVLVSVLMIDAPARAEDTLADLGGTATPACSKGQNLQDNFLNTLRKEHTPVSVGILSGFEVDGTIEAVDKDVIIMRIGTDEDPGTQMIYKHAISTIVPGKAVTEALLSELKTSSDECTL